MAAFVHRKRLDELTGLGVGVARAEVVAPEGGAVRNHRLRRRRVGKTRFIVADENITRIEDHAGPDHPGVVDRDIIGGHFAVTRVLRGAAAGEECRIGILKIQADKAVDVVADREARLVGAVD